MDTDREIATSASAASLFDAQLEIYTATPLKGGLCNKTFLTVMKDGRRAIVQKLHPVLTPDILTDSHEICTHLRRAGWQVPLPFTNGGKPYVEMDDHLFRAYDFIEGKNIPSVGLEKARQIGEVLAKFHQGLAQLSVKTPASIPYFHDTAFIFDQLAQKEGYFARRTDVEQHLFQDMMAAWADNQPAIAAKSQIIHGDARVQNFLESQSGDVFTMIDCDTFMQGSIFTDIGDLLRSISCDDAQTTIALEPDKINAVIEGYGAVSGDDRLAFRQNCLSGFRTICLELAARFMNDICDDCYFGWDDTKYASRAENNLDRAHCQFQLYQEASTMEHRYAA